MDEPIAICALKRYVADEIFKNNEPFVDLVFPKKNKSIGIVGAGISGLTCGYYLARLGYDVTAYEAQPVAGGVLVYGIPEYRLPKEILRKEIDTIRQVGVNIITDIEVGKDIAFEELQSTYDALYIATGAQFSKKIGIEGENLPGVYHGFDYLKDVNLGKEVCIDGVVAIIGGGSTAFDAARVATRKGAKEVHILYRRTSEDMPADQSEIKEAVEEGIIIHELVRPIAILGKECVNQIRCIEMELSGFDSDGRRKPVDISESEYNMDVDHIIIAVSQYSDLPFINKEEVEATHGGRIVVDKDTQMTSKPGVFSGGDAVRGSDVVITAIADGKKAAVAMDKYLGGDGILNKGDRIDIPQVYDDSEIMEHNRFEMEYLNADERKENFEEVCLGYHRLNAIAESMRCLRCDRKLKEED